MNLKFYRTKRNLSISQLSEISSIPIRTIEDIEKRGSCKIDTAKKLAEALNINPYDLVSEHYCNLPYAALDFTDVLNAILPLINPNDFQQLIIDKNTYRHGIHVKSMDKIYQIYEDYLAGKIGNTKIHWEPTLEQW